MIWKVTIVEARPTDDENTYEFTAPTLGSDGHQIQILDFSPGLQFVADGDDEDGECIEVEPATVVYAYPDRSD